MNAERVYPSVPKDAVEDRRLELRQRGIDDLYFFTRGVLGYNLLVPHAHKHLCKFADTCDALRRMFLMPRSHFKTTIITIAQTMQDVCKDPNDRILIVGSSSTNAERFLSEISQHFKRNQLFRWLYPELIHDSFTASDVTWTGSEITVPRDLISRDPTVDTIGARGTVESRHYNKIRADDIIGEKELNSAVEMERTIEWVTGLESLLISPDRDLIDFVGTHWRFQDVYAFIQEFYAGNVKEEEAEEIGPFASRRGDLVLFRRDARHEDGEPIFPEQVSKAFLDRLQRENPLRYAAQYANDPQASGETKFDYRDLRFYEFVGPERRMLRVEDAEGNTKLIPISKLDLGVLTDPSVAETRGASDTAILLVGHYEAKDWLFVLEENIGQIQPDETVDHIFRLCKDFSLLRFVSIEQVAYQKALKYWIRREADSRKRPYPPVVEYKPGTQRTKDERIEGLLPRVRSHKLFLLPGHHKLIAEFKRYTKDGKSKRDGLDALSQAIDHFGKGWSEEHEEDTRERWREQLRVINSTGYGVKRRRPA